MIYKVMHPLPIVMTNSSNLTNENIENNKSKAVERIPVYHYVM
jgi:hypothetical protein